MSSYVPPLPNLDAIQAGQARNAIKMRNETASALRMSVATSIYLHAVTTFPIPAEGATEKLDRIAEASVRASERLVLALGLAEE